MNERKGLENMGSVKIVIIGASFAGISSAITAKSLNEQAEVIVIDRQASVGFVPSSMNRLLKGKIETLTEQPAVTVERLEQLGVKMMLSTEVVDISVDNKKLTLIKNSEEAVIHYDKLILAMGSIQTSERIEGTNHPKVLTSKTLAASLKSQEELNQTEHILIVGGGYVGLEAADAYKTAGKKVTLVEAFDSLAFKAYDPEMMIELEKRMEEQGVTIHKNQQTKAIQETDKGLRTLTSQNNQYHSDHVLLAVSFRPNTQLIQDQIDTHLDQTIAVDDYLKTSHPDIYATGDLIRVPYKGTKSDYYLPLVNHAVITGRIAAMNALGLSEPLEPFVRVVGSQLFGLYIGSVGLTEEEARLYHETETITHHRKIEHEIPITLKLIVDKTSGQLLGGQVYSEMNIFGLMDTLALAIKAEMRDRDLALQDFLYYSTDSIVMPVLQESAFLMYQKRLKGAS